VSGSKARTYGMPAAVVDEALAQGVHPDCLISRNINDTKSSCDDCRIKVVEAIDKVYVHIEHPIERANQMVADAEREQLGGD
jgi:hypothetical protein